MSSFGSDVGVLLLPEDMNEHGRRFFTRGSSSNEYEPKSDFKADATVLFSLEDISERD